MLKNFEKAPSQYSLYHLQATLEQGNETQVPGTSAWVPARPEGYYGWRNRLSKAWKVFTGRADIVVWPGGQ